MMRMFAWCGMNAARSSAVMPAASSACWATFAISQTAQRKTVGPSWRSVGQSTAPAPSRYAASGLSMPTASHFDAVGAPDGRGDARLVGRAEHRGAGAVAEEEGDGAVGRLRERATASPPRPRARSRRGRSG